MGDERKRKTGKITGREKEKDGSPPLSDTGRGRALTRASHAIVAANQLIRECGLEKCEGPSFPGPCAERY